VRRLVCIACRDRIPLEGSEVGCRCGRSAATLGTGGWGYIGPAVVARPVVGNGPPGMQRLVTVPDDDVSHRAPVGPLL
jgi:hypothetical protein